MQVAVKIENIRKTYGDIVALKDISLRINEGEIFGIIGPDGSGKTSLFRILATLLLADSGTVSLLGLDVVKDYKALRKMLGYMPGRFSLYQDLTVEENINLFASLFGTTVAAQYDIIKDIYSQIEPFKDRRAGKLSGGMKQKLALSCALVHKPRILLLDEPTTGVDPVSRKEFWGMLKRLKAWNITIVVSTPYMDEAMQCDRVALIQDGNIMSVDTPDNIVNEFPARLYAVKTSNKHTILTDLRDFEYTGSAFAFGDHIHFTDVRTEFTNDELKAYLEEKGHTDIDISETTATIEDCFMELMRKKI